MTNTITKEFLDEQIEQVAYYQLPNTTLTIAVITLNSGFTVTGESACVDPSNFDKAIGEKIAYENAYEKLWQLFGFELKQKLGTGYLYRLKRERNELHGQLEKLSSYLDNPSVDEEHLKLLKEQKDAMEAYLTILDKRLNYF